LRPGRATDFPSRGLRSPIFFPVSAFKRCPLQQLSYVPPVPLPFIPFSRLNHLRLFFVLSPRRCVCLLCTMLTRFGPPLDPLNEALLPHVRQSKNADYHSSRTFSAPKYSTRLNVRHSPSPFPLCRHWVSSPVWFVDFDGGHYFLTSPTFAPGPYCRPRQFQPLSSHYSGTLRTPHPPVLFPSSPPNCDIFPRPPFALTTAQSHHVPLRPTHPLRFFLNQAVQLASGLGKRHNAAPPAATLIF